MTEAEIAAVLAALNGVFPNLSITIPVFGTDVKITLAEVSQLLNGTAITIPVDAFKEPVLGKTLTVSLAANGVSLAIA